MTGRGGLRLRPAGDARGDAGLRRTGRARAARPGVGHGLRVRRVLRLRRADRATATCASASTGRCSSRASSGAVPVARDDFCGIELAHPVVNGSGTFDAIAAQRAFGDALIERSRSARSSPRRHRRAAPGQPAAAAVGVAGRADQLDRAAEQGLAGYLEHDLPRSPAARAADRQRHGLHPRRGRAARGDVGERAEVAALELNVSCPNVKSGLIMGADPNETAALLDAVRPLTAKPLIVKLTPNADPGAVAAAAEAAGADAVSLINTLRGMALHPRAGEPWLGGGTGGVSGPAVRAVALAQVADVARRVGIPVVGMGGVQADAMPHDLLDGRGEPVAVGRRASGIRSQERGSRPSWRNSPQRAGFCRSERAGGARRAWRLKKTWKLDTDLSSDASPNAIDLRLRSNPNWARYAACPAFRRDVDSPPVPQATKSLSKPSVAAPERSLDQRMEALDRQRDPHPAGTAQARPQGRPGSASRDCCSIRPSSSRPRRSSTCSSRSRSTAG